MAFKYKFAFIFAHIIQTVPDRFTCNDMLPTWTSGMPMKMQINYSIHGLYAFFITFESKC